MINYSYITLFRNGECAIYMVLRRNNDTYKFECITNTEPDCEELVSPDGVLTMYHIIKEVLK